jgi:hypothetical protein
MSNGFLACSVLRVKKNKSSIAKQLINGDWRGSNGVIADSSAAWNNSTYPAKLAMAYNYLDPKAEEIVGRAFLIANESLKPFVIDMVICVDNENSLRNASSISEILASCFTKMSSSFRDSLVLAKKTYEEEQKANLDRLALAKKRHEEEQKAKLDRECAEQFQEHKEWKAARGTTVVRRCLEGSESACRADKQLVYMINRYPIKEECLKK